MVAIIVYLRTDECLSKYYFTIVGAPKFRVAATIMQVRGRRSNGAMRAGTAGEEKKGREVGREGSGRNLFQLGPIYKRGVCGFDMFRSCPLGRAVLILSSYEVHTYAYGVHM